MRSGAHGLVGQLARFAAALRSEGIRAGLGDEIDAARALELVDLVDRAEVYRALRIAFKVSRASWVVFDRLFGEVWDGDGPSGSAPRPQTRHGRGSVARWMWDGARVRVAMPDEEEPPVGDTPSYSPEPMLRRKPFERCSAAEVARLEQMLARLAPRLAVRRSRRFVPAPTRGRVDLRRSFRQALASEGDVLRLARRKRAIEEPRVVVLYDTSGSMDAYTRLLLAFAFALRRTIKRVEIFAFNTTLVRVSRLLSPVEVERSLEKLGAAVPDWSGGTRIGDCLQEFNRHHGDALVDRNTTVMVFSDGLDHGDAGVLSRAMQALQERSRRILWLNPLLGDARYRPEAAGMQAALPYIDHFGPAHNLESLESLIRNLT